MYAQLASIAILDATPKHTCSYTDVPHSLGQTITQNACTSTQACPYDVL